MLASSCAACSARPGMPDVDALCVATSSSQEARDFLAAYVESVWSTGAFSAQYVSSPSSPSRGIISAWPDLIKHSAKPHQWPLRFARTSIEQSWQPSRYSVAFLTGTGLRRVCCGGAREPTQHQAVAPTVLADHADNAGPTSCTSPDQSRVVVNDLRPSRQDRRGRITSPRRRAGRCGAAVSSWNSIVRCHIRVDRTRGATTVEVRPGDGGFHVV